LGHCAADYLMLARDCAYPEHVDLLLSDGHKYGAAAGTFEAGPVITRSVSQAC
jgi:hypothetical protein